MTPDAESSFFLTSVEIGYFRGFEEVSLDLGRVSVIVGVNGAGKSSALVAISFLLEEVVRFIGPAARKGRSPSTDDFHNGSKYCSVRATLERLGPTNQISVVFGSNHSRGFSIVVPERMRARSLGREMFAEIEAKDETILPIFSFYPVSRATHTVPLRIPAKSDHSRLAGYTGAFASDRDYALFFQWFREQEDGENEIRSTSKPAYRDPQLQAVRTAVERALPGYLNLRVQRRPRLRMVVDKEGSPISIQQMSDGERGLITLVGDIARRACLLNPRLEDPLTTPGVVLIDEIEQHLHPQWQRRIVQILPKVFPNIQFLVTTHSPIVCNSVRPSELLVLRDGEALSATAYGWSVQDVLREVFEINDRPQDIEERLSDLDKALDEADIEEARRIVAELSLLLPSTDAELVRAGVLLPFLEQEQGSEGG